MRARFQSEVVVRTLVFARASHGVAGGNGRGCEGATGVLDGGGECWGPSSSYNTTDAPLALAPTHDLALTRQFSATSGGHRNLKQSSKLDPITLAYHY